MRSDGWEYLTAKLAYAFFWAGVACGLLFAAAVAAVTYLVNWLLEGGAA